MSTKLRVKDEHVEHGGDEVGGDEDFGGIGGRSGVCSSVSDGLGKDSRVSCGSRTVSDVFDEESDILR